MNLLFDKSYPKDLVEVLKQIHELDTSHCHTLAYYDKSINESALQKPVVFLFDYKKHGLDVTTQKLFESGYGIIALKTDRIQKLDFFDLSVTLLGLWPKILRATREHAHPFVLTYRFKGQHLNKHTFT